jgi:uncharacterized Zn finger protein (UPF0148 family)
VIFHCPDCGAQLLDNARDYWCPSCQQSLTPARLLADRDNDSDA